jgi:ABC-type branched-subunit amino acid transport system substrate-binding protein
LTAEAKVPLLISIAAGGAQIPRISPYVARVSYTLWQQGYPIGKWAAEQGWKKGYTAVSDFIPGNDSEGSFTKGFTEGGGTIIGSVRMPPQNPDFVPFMQRIRDAKPDVAFLWIPGAQATAIFDLVNATKGKFTADEAMEFFKKSKNPDNPRGPVAIDPATRDVPTALRQAASGRYRTVDAREPLVGCWGTALTLVAAPTVGGPTLGGRILFCGNDDEDGYRLESSRLILGRTLRA